MDVQAGTLPNARAVTPDELVAHVREVVDAFRSAGRPVHFVVSTGTPPGDTAAGSGGRMWPEGFDVLDPRLQRHESEPLWRRAGWSAFAGTGIIDALHGVDVDTVVLVGLATTFGIESSARAAYDAGFSVVVVTDAVSDPDAERHDGFLTRVLPALGRGMRAADLA